MHVDSHFDDDVTDPGRQNGHALPARRGRLYFDPRDYALLETVRELQNRDKPSRSLRRLVDPYLHPHGVKELAAASDVRIAHAALALLDSLEAGKASERLAALRSLRDEVIHAASSHLRLNTARVLLSIVKDLLRSAGDPQRQLELAHDFHAAASGRPRLIRRLLRRYHLLEMPEAWNQVAFDDHVHDANTKGRKSPTHMILDAWIKGIRFLQVVYYHHVRDEVAAELMEAAEIMGVTVRIGIEVPGRFREGYAKVIWVPRGFLGARDFLEFLAEPPVRAFMEDGKAISEHRQRHVLRVLQEFNTRHRLSLNHQFGLELEPITEEAFLALVGAGQPSLLHLAELLQRRLLEAMRGRVRALRAEYAQADPQRRTDLERQVALMSELDAQAIWERYLRPAANPQLPDPNVPSDSPDTPAQLRRSLPEVIEAIHKLPAGYRLTLNLSDLSTEDVLEILYDCRGRITHLEVFNLKDWAAGKARSCAEIDELRHALNEAHVVALKRLVRRLIARVQAGPHSAERVEKLQRILADVGSLMQAYRGTPLSTRVGSDSAGRSASIHGMGLALTSTLPPRAQAEIVQADDRSREVLPVLTTARLQVTYTAPSPLSPRNHPLLRALRRLPGLRGLGLEKSEEWTIEAVQTRVGGLGNVATLGGLREDPHDGLSLEPPRPAGGQVVTSPAYLNTQLLLILKIMLGFIPAFLTFALTKDWWVLAYLGAFIWFGITGLRNILQSVLGGGGLRRSPLLRWNHHVSWGRVADSLLYTGFSVPLLDYLVKSLLMDRGLGITTHTGPLLLYSVMAIANGAYISSHNYVRGLPRSAVVANFFRAVLSIPIAFGLNAGLRALFMWQGAPGDAVDTELQKWAAIISKAASDMVAGFIEGSADRLVNLDQRMRDYTTKLQQLFDCHGKLELLYPDQDVLALLASPKEFIRAVKADAAELERGLILNALDLLYFWMYQPRARSMLRRLLRRMDGEERQIFLRSQAVLERQREISQLLVDGLVSKNFSRPLAFYLERAEDYLRAMRRMVASADREQARTAREAAPPCAPAA
ncbi:MAG TPA: hypothetical protein PK668_11440 [Myxococcota bacterium]|nr:hypothetical protein [Myxococcota bacterium]HRY93220.1 hypothetical protein [Myxococcota bacterium]HSA21011.1 hypothetical protein [Myxococcota bacterium]